MYDWHKFKHRNEKDSADCQVVTAVNAYYFLTGQQVYKDEKYYQYLCELAKACYGSAICIEKVHEELGLETFDETKFDFDILNDDEFKIIHPIEMIIWHLKYGFHSALIVDRSMICHAIRVVNFEWETTNDGWMWEENLDFFVNEMNKDWTFRKFRLKGNR